MPVVPGRRERKRRQLCDQVAAVAFGLFEELGFAAVTMEQVAAAADIAKGTLYRHFPVKEALLAYRFQRDIASGTSSLWRILERQNSFAAQLKCLLHAWAKWNEARRTYLAHVVRYEFGLSRLEGCDRALEYPLSGPRQILERLCGAGQRRGDVRPDVPARQLAVMIDGMCLGAIVIWLRTPDGNLKTEFDALLRVALNGVGT